MDDRGDRRRDPRCAGRRHRAGDREPLGLHAGRIRVDPRRVPDLRVFLDLINPVSALEDPLPAVRDLAPLAASPATSRTTRWSRSGPRGAITAGGSRCGGATREKASRISRACCALESTLGGRSSGSPSRAWTTLPTGATRSVACATASPSSTRSPRRRPDVRCVVFTGAGGNEVVRLEERLDPEPGSEDVIVDQRFAGLNPADLQQRAGRYPAPHGARRTSPAWRSAARSSAAGAGRDLAAGRSRLRARGRRRAGGPRRGPRTRRRRGPGRAVRRVGRRGRRGVHHRS